ncbi:NUDIX domain-containing protein [Patescibacteria group bacterium]|nr:NUDIX domain-containing protein [Patescibacteria group bacterium]
MNISVVYGWCQLPNGFGYDAVMWDENGGPVNMVYYRALDGTVHVAMLSQYRKLMNTEANILNAPRGFKETGEKVEDAALREILEETGGFEVGAPIQLGNPINPNSGVENSTNGRSLVYFFGFEVKEGVVEETSRGVVLTEDFKAKMKARAEAKKAAGIKATNLLEVISGAVFVPLDEACDSPDYCGLTATAALRLKFHLQQADRNTEIQVG